MAWFWIIAAVVYILSPYDLLPDFIPIRGWLDDIVILVLLIRFIRRFRQGRPAGYNQPGDNQRDQENRTDSESQSRPANDNPYSTLGIPHGADQDEIQKAYRKLANQYHPDKVTHLGKEFQELAEKRFKEIQQAYERIRVKK